MADTRQVKWFEVDNEVSGLETDNHHEIQVQREAIPLVFVPGIMGSRLRLAGTNGQGDGANGLPNMRWDPSNTWFMFWNYGGADPSFRKRMLIGDGVFSPIFLEVDNSDPVGDGSFGIFKNYYPFLDFLRHQNWGPLGKIFQFPVYAVGYNWTDTNEHAGKKLVTSVQEIINEAKNVTGLCEKVILITHSMGGLVSRWASEMEGLKSTVVGIIHGVQPVTGAPAAYWRMKAGFEWAGGGLAGWEGTRVLGDSGPKVTPILANVPGGLQLLPNKLHRTNAGSPSWLTVTENGQTRIELPKSDPYDEIYRKKARVQPTPGERPSTNMYWALVDPDLLNPNSPKPNSASLPDPNGNNAIRAAAPRYGDPWDQYLKMLDVAEQFHDKLQDKPHAKTWCFRGVDHATADVIELRTESNWFRSDSYPTRGFRGFFTDAQGNSMQAVLQDPSIDKGDQPDRRGNGDGTVPVFSASKLDSKAQGNEKFPVEHEPAYKNSKAQAYALKAVIALCKLRYEDRKG